MSGDEFGRTQNGNNNPYKIDSIGIWNNYGMLATSRPTTVSTGGSGVYHDNYGDDRHPSGGNGLFRFVQCLTSLRRACDSLRVDRFADLALDSGGDVTYWFKRADAQSDLRDGDRSVHWRIDGSAVGDRDLLVCVNMAAVDVVFVLPPPTSGLLWRRLIDTATWAEPQGNCWPADRAEAIGSSYTVHGFSVAVFQER